MPVSLYPFAVLIFAMTATSEAASVSRCIDTNGRVAFSFNGCSGSIATQVEAYNPPPGGDQVVPMATTQDATKPQTGQRREAVVVGARDDGCGNLLDAREKRQAIIRGEVRQGMSRADVESAFGQPQRTRASNGQLRYYYENHKERTRQVTFDEHGCVK